MRTVLAVLLILFAPATRACETALLLSIDVSQSIDVAEYRTYSKGWKLAPAECLSALVSD